MATRLQSWGNFLTWLAEEVYAPTSLEELKKIIAIANLRGARIRTGGSFHTLNPLYISKEIQIVTENLNKVLLIDKENMRVKVQGGIKLYTLLEVLAKEGLTLPCQSYITKQSAAGLIATATHGTGKTGSMCSIVEEIELLDYNGHVHKLSPEKNEHLFNGALVSLGCFGVIYSVTFRCISRYKLKLNKYEQKLEDTLNELPTILKIHDNVLIHINPYKKLAYPSCYQITDEPTTNRIIPNIKWFIRKTIAFISMNLPFYPPRFLIPPFLNLFLKASRIKNQVDYNDFILSPSDDGNWVEEEFFVSMDVLKEALNTVIEIVNKSRKEGNTMVVPVTLRFIDADSYGYMSPFYNNPTVAISVVAIPKEGYNNLFKEIETALSKFKARPHWGKIHFLNKQDVLDLYGSNVLLFNSVRHLLDPHKMFYNYYIEHLLEG